MTPFLAKLRELIAKATLGPFWVGRLDAPDGRAMAWNGSWFVDTKTPKVIYDGEMTRYRNSQADAEIHALMRNNAEAIADLVESVAEQIKHCPECAGKVEISLGIAKWDCPECKPMRAALSKLNGEKI